MSIRLLDAWDVKTQALHTAIDDLESFLWVLVWSLVYILKRTAKIHNKNSKIHLLERALSSRDLAHTIRKESITKRRWTDKVFFKLIQEWLAISEEYREVVERLQIALLTANDIDRERVFDELDKGCQTAYKRFIEAGYRNLQAIKEYDSWDAVVHFDGESLHT